LQKYFADKPEYFLLNKRFSDSGDFIMQEAENDFINIKIINPDYNIYSEFFILYCEIELIEVPYFKRALFEIPAEYSDFKCLLDIFLKYFFEIVYLIYL
jgi:hypothetical protein